MQKEKTISKKLIDLDELEGFILTITHNSQVRSLTKSELLALLDLHLNLRIPASSQGLNRLNSVRATRTLASVGNHVSRYLNDLKSKPPKLKDSDDELELINVLKEFDGLVGERAKSSIYPNIQNLIKMNISSNLKDELVRFKEKHSAIAKIKLANK